MHALKPSETSKLNRLPRHSHEAWQVMVVPINAFGPRAMSAPGQPPADSTLVRPHCIFVLGLHPVGRVLATARANPADESPDMRTILEALMECMFRPTPNPAQKDVPNPPHRPGKVLFHDAGMAAVCSLSLKDIGIECGTCEAHPGIPRIVEMFSVNLLQSQAVVRTQRSLQPPLYMGEGISDPLLQAFYRLAQQFAAMRPWELASQRQSIRIHCKEPCSIPIKGGGTVQVEGNQTVWVSVQGMEPLRARMAALQAGVPPDKAPQAMRGLAVYYRRHDMEQHTMSELHLMRKEAAKRGSNAVPSIDISKRPAAVSNPLDQICDNCAQKAANGVDLLVCGGCRSARYCPPGEGQKQSTCQKAHWESHKSFCKENPANPDRDPRAPNMPDLADRYFSVRETVLALENPMGSVIYDLDKMAKLGCLPGPEDAANHPFALTFRRGAATLPKADELLWLCRGLAVTIAMIRKYRDRLVLPIAMQGEVELDLRAVTRPGGSVRQVQQESTAVVDHSRILSPPTVSPQPEWWEVFNDTPFVSVRTDPILTPEEMGNMREKYNKEQAVFVAMARNDVEEARQLMSELGLRNAE